MEAWKTERWLSVTMEDLFEICTEYLFPSDLIPKNPCKQLNLRLPLLTYCGIRGRVELWAWQSGGAETSRL